MPGRSWGQRCWPVCGVVLPGVVAVLGWPPPGALAELGPMPAAASVLEDVVPAGEPDDEVPLVLVLELVPDVVVELLPVLAASPPVVLAVDGAPVPVSEAVSVFRWQAPSAAAAAIDSTRLRAMDEVGVM